jgi:invasion protein IalB
MRISALPVLVVLLTGCASQPESTPAIATRPPEPVAARVVVAAPSVVTPTGAAAAGQQPKAPAGYKLVTRNGETLYCQKTTQLGSRFPKEVCMTPQEYDDMSRRAESDRQNFRKNSTLCGTGGCGGG